MNTLGNMIQEITQTAIKGLQRFYCNYDRVFYYTVKKDKKRGVYADGYSTRYAAMSQIGIARWLEYHPEDKQCLPDLWPGISDNLHNISQVSDLALSLLAGLQSKAENCSDFAQSLI